MVLFRIYFHVRTSTLGRWSVDMKKKSQGWQQGLGLSKEMGRCIATTYRDLSGIDPWWLSGKESACQCRRRKRHGFDPSVGKSPWRRKWQPTSLCLPRKSHGQRSLVGYSPWSQTVGHDWATNNRQLRSERLRQFQEMLSRQSVTWVCISR